jgi:hypothetical protein
MATTTATHIQFPPSLTGKEAVKNEQTFAAWSEAVKQQMLAALQKRQRLD